MTEERSTNVWSTVNYSFQVLMALLSTIWTAYKICCNQIQYFLKCEIKWAKRKRSGSQAEKKDFLLDILQEKDKASSSESEIKEYERYDPI